MPMTTDQLAALRVLIPDTDAVFGTAGDEYLLSDDQLNALYDTTGRGSILRTAGWACRAMGNSDLARMPTIRNDEISTDGARSAAEWRLAAKQFWDMADDEDDQDGAGDYFDLINPYPCPPHAEASPWGYRSWD